MSRSVALGLCAENRLGCTVSRERRLHFVAGFDVEVDRGFGQVQSATAMQPEYDVPLDSEPSIEIRGVDFVTLWVRDWANARTFYGNVLALPLSAHYERASSSEYEAGEVTLQVRLVSGDEDALIGKTGTIALHVG